MNKLKVEINKAFVADENTQKLAASGILVTPPVSDAYWLFRVNLFEDQSVIAFPKFMTLGIGFAIEDDWNTNLPYKQEAEIICNHIWHNRRYIAIKKKRTICAIELLQKTIKEHWENNS